MNSGSQHHDAPHLNALPLPKQESRRALWVQALLNFKTEHDHSLFLTFPSPRLCLQAAFLGRECLRPHWQIWVPGHAPAAMGLLPCPPTLAAGKPAFRGAPLRAAWTVRRAELKCQKWPGCGQGALRWLTLLKGACLASGWNVCNSKGLGGGGGA